MIAVSQRPKVRELLLGESPRVRVFESPLRKPALSQERKLRLARASLHNLAAREARAVDRLQIEGTAGR